MGEIFMEPFLCLWKSPKASGRITSLVSAATPAGRAFPKTMRILLHDSPGGRPRTANVEKEVHYAPQPNLEMNRYITRRWS